MSRYVAGVAYSEGGDFFAGAIHDTENDLIYPLDTLERAEEVASLMNQGMPCTLWPGISLTFRTAEEAIS
jgi:hypothetical protein